ncbi:MAG: hypothetical protein HETSPECPRED_010542, partial [Heterodermia speciosa]
HRDLSSRQKTRGRSRNNDLQRITGNDRGARCDTRDRQQAHGGSRSQGDDLTGAHMSGPVQPSAHADHFRV